MFAYDSALARMQPRRLCVDIGCGYGYAIERVAGHSRRVLAVDSSRVALASLPDNPGLSKVRSDARRLALPDCSVDYVLCFQVVEHVPTRDAVVMLREMHRILRPGGRAFLTTPNAKWRLLPGQAPWNRHHVVEYGPAEIVSLCEEAGVHREMLIRGVLGLSGAQEIERARVAQNPVKVLGWNRTAAWLQLGAKIMDRKLRVGRSKRKSVVRASDLQRKWFILDDGYQDGLDFWIEFGKQV